MFVEKLKVPEESGDFGGKPLTPRTKKKAPLPPTNPPVSSPKTRRAPPPPAGNQGVTSENGSVTSLKKKQAPSWKEEVERKMREANLNNLQDVKFVVVIFK